METRTGSPTGWSPTPVPLLNHVNLGAPLVHPGSRVHSGAADVVAREPVADLPDPTRLPEPLDGPTEAVHEHRGLPVRDGRASVLVTCPVSDVAAEVSRSAAGVPRLYQWTWPARRGWALGVEPSNAALFGPGAGTDGRAAPPLEPGEVLRTELTVRLVARPEPGR